MVSQLPLVSHQRSLSELQPIKVPSFGLTGLSHGYGPVSRVLPSKLHPTCSITSLVTHLSGSGERLLRKSLLSLRNNMHWQEPSTSQIRLLHKDIQLSNLEQMFLDWTHQCELMNSE